MGKTCIILTIAAILLGESWILFGDRQGNEMVTFLDGQHHGVSLWWFIRDIADILMYCVLSFATCIGWMAKDKRVAYFFWIVFIYFDCNLIVWIYNYSTNRYIFFAMITAVIIWTGAKFWPGKKQMKIV